MKERDIPASDVRVGDRVSWDRPERFLWLTVTAIARVLHDEGQIQICFDFYLPFAALSGLGEFPFASDAVEVTAINVDQQAICLRQWNTFFDVLRVQRKTEAMDE